MDLNQQESLMGVKIQPPPSEEEKLGFLYILLVVLSSLLIFFVFWLQIWEWIGKPLPQFLKLPIA